MTSGKILQMKDDYGNIITAGCKLRLAVGIPTRDVIVEVKKRGRHLVVENEEGVMPLMKCLRFYNAEVIKADTQ